MANTPNIRFKGFTDDWEQRKVGDISTITAGGTPSTKELSYWEPKEIPWLSSGEVHKKYIYDTDEMISEKGLINSSAKWVEKDSVLIALAGQGKTRGTAAITRVPITTNQSIAAIKFDNILNPDYAFQNLDLRYDELRNISSGDGTRGGLNKQLLSDLEIMFPSLEEQKQIGAYFYNHDHLITLHQRKCDEAKQLKKFMLQKMFPKSGELIPEIRFAGFTDDWEQRKLGEVVSEFKSGVSLQADKIEAKGAYPVYGGNGLRGYTSTYNHDGEFALIGRQGALCGNMNYSMGKAYFTEHAVAIQADENNDTRFIYYLLDTMQLGQYSDQSAQPGLAVNKLIKLENMFPDKSEQAKISTYFANLDHLITLHQCKCDKLKEVKKFMLQNMFPQKG